MFWRLLFNILQHIFSKHRTAGRKKTGPGVSIMCTPAYSSGKVSLRLHCQRMTVNNRVLLVLRNTFKTYLELHLIPVCISFLQRQIMKQEQPICTHSMNSRSGTVSSFYSWKCRGINQNYNLD